MATNLIRRAPKSRRNSDAVSDAFDIEALQQKQLDLEQMLHHGRSDQKVLMTAEALSLLLDKTPSLEKSDERRFWLSRALTSEAFDSLGRFGEAAREVARGREVLLALPTDEEAGALDANQRRLVRDRVRYCLTFALAQYRLHYYEKAREIVARCFDLVTNGLVRTEHPHFGLRGACEYLGGRILRQLGKYEEAEQCFERAITHFYQRSEYTNTRALNKGPESTGNGQELENDAAHDSLDATYSMHRSALCLSLGHGWVQFARGHLTQARRDTLGARLQLLQANDTLNLRYVEVLLGSILRSQAGTERSKLREAETLVEEARQEFERRGHHLYRARAACELALIYLYLGDQRAALERITEAELLAESLNDISLQVQAAATKSRIVRSGVGAHLVASRMESERIASLAISNAQRESSQVPGLTQAPALVIAALVARGVARLYLDRHEEARADFEHALSLNQPGANPVSADAETSSPMIDGTCNVFLAWSYARQGNADKADQAFRRWKEVEPRIEHAALLERAVVVERDINNLFQDFVVKADTRSLDHETHSKGLRSFLIHQASLRERGNKVLMAKSLGVSRQTLHEWERSLFGVRKKVDAQRGRRAAGSDGTSQKRPKRPPR